MSVQLLLITIAISAVLIFLFYTSGIIITDVFSIRFQNPFSAIAIGFFTFFAFLSVFSFPMQLISSLTYKFFIYYTIALLILYFLICMIFIKYWITTNIISIKTLVFLLVTTILFLVNYFTNRENSVIEFARHRNNIALIIWMKESTVSFFSNSALFNFLGFKPFESWYTFQVAIVDILSLNSIQYNSVLVPLTTILEAFLSASIFVTMFHAFKKSNKQLYSWILLIVSLGTFITTRLATIYLGLFSFSENTIFIYLVFESMILLLMYTSVNYRMKKIPFLINIVLGSYISFSWENSYPILFLIYTFIFVIQSRYKQNFIKDIIRISFITLLNFFFFNIIQGLLVQSILSGLAIFVTLLFSLSSLQRFSKVVDFEIFLQKNRKLSVFALPTIFGLISMALLLQYSNPLNEIQNNYIVFLEYWVSWIENSNNKTIIFGFTALSLTAFSFLWLLFRRKISNSILTNIVDAASISYLTFYNPIVIKFINVIYPDMLKLNGVVIFVSVIILINIFVYYLEEKISAKIKSNSKINIYKNWISKSLCI